MCNGCNEPCPVAKLVGEAIGGFSATLAWGTSDRRLFLGMKSTLRPRHRGKCATCSASSAWAFMRLALVVEDQEAKAVVLPLVRPQWLEENIRAEAAKVGNTVEKQQNIFQVEHSHMIGMLSSRNMPKTLTRERFNKFHDYGSVRVSFNSQVAVVVLFSDGPKSSRIEVMRS